MKVAALCAGYGGLELALRDVWPCADTAWVAELDPHASQVLERRFGVPNLGDLTEITDPPPVDIVTAGFPCQPVSTAGRRKGVTDERWIIDDVCRVARAAGATTLVLENVVGLLSANDGDAMARVCAAMASHGFDRWRWTTVRASDVGACHRRDRWFCVAGDAAGWRRLRTQRPDGPGAETDRAGEPVHVDRPIVGEPVAHADGEPAGRHTGTDAGTQGEHAGRATHHRDRSAHGSRAAAHAHGERLEERRVSEAGERAHGADAVGCGRFGPYQPAVDRWAAILGRAAPDPLTDGRLNPRFVEWMMGLPAGWVTDIVDTRSHALRILGNGVVPQQAAHALRHLAVVPC